MRLNVVAAASLILSFTVACGKKKEEHTVIAPLSVEGYESLRDVRDAPQPAAATAAAVVKIGLANGSSATGFFISADGLMVTNNHVIGSETCVRAGCYVTLSFEYQRGGAYKDVDVFAEPVAVNSTLDVNLIQIKSLDDKGAAAGALATPAFLTWRKAAAKDLVGEKIYIVGHPLGALKKWSAGTVYAYSHDWIYSDAFTMPGDSGSPLVDQNGQVVGINHRGGDSREDLDAKGYESREIATSSGAFLDSIGSDGLSLTGAARPASVTASLLDLNAIAADEIAAKSDFVLMARAIPTGFKLTGGGIDPAAVVTAKASACDAGLKAKTDGVTPEDQAAPLLDHCLGARTFFNCGDRSIDGGYKSCPSGADASVWLKRFDDAAIAYGDLSLGKPYYALVASSRSLYSGVKDRRTAAAAALNRYLAARNPAPDISLAYAELLTSLDGQGLMWQGTDLVDLVTSYEVKGDAARFASTVAYSYTQLDDLGLIPKGAAKDRYAEILANPEVSLGQKLYIESFAFEIGYLDP